MEKELLLVLSERTGCIYLSDLKFIQDKGRIKFELQRLVPQDFPLNQWNDAVEFFTGQKRKFSSSNEAKDFLINTEFIKY